MYEIVATLQSMLEYMRLNENARISELVATALLSASIFFTVYAGIFAIKAVAVCIMAKKRAIKNWWLGMIPFANFVIIGKLAGPVRVFSVDIKNVGWIVAVASGVSTIFSIVMSALVYGDYFAALLKNALPVNAEYVFKLSYLVEITSGVYSYLEYVLSLVYVISYAMLAYAFFSKYSPEKRWLFSLLSVFIEPLFGIFILIVRKNRAYSSINEYYNEKYARRFGQTYNPYSDPFRTKENPYNDGKNANNSDPFDEPDGGDDSSPFEGF